MRFLGAVTFGFGSLAVWGQIAHAMGPLSRNASGVMGMIMVLTTIAAVVIGWKLFGDLDG